MTPDMLRSLHLFHANAARDTLLKDGRVYPFMHFVCPAAGLEAKLEQLQLQTIPFGDAMAEHAVVTMSGGYNPTELINAFNTFVAPNPRAIELSRKVGMQMFGDAERVDQHILNALCMAGKTDDPKDVLAAIIRGAIKKLDAYAFIKVDEAWLLETEGGAAEAKRVRGETKNISDHPLRQECLFVALEWRKGAVIAKSKVIRERPGDDQSKLVEVTEPEIRDDMTFEGRYAGFFRDVH